LIELTKLDELFLLNWNDLFLVFTFLFKQDYSYILELILSSYIWVSVIIKDLLFEFKSLTFN